MLQIIPLLLLAPRYFFPSIFFFTFVCMSTFLAITCANKLLLQVTCWCMILKIFPYIIAFKIASVNILIYFCILTLNLPTKMSWPDPNSPIWILRTYFTSCFQGQVNPLVPILFQSIVVPSPIYIINYNNSTFDILPPCNQLEEYTFQYFYCSAFYHIQ